MKNLKKLALGSISLIGLFAIAPAAYAQDTSAPAPAAPASAAMTTPAMAGPLSANPNPFSVDLGDNLLGKVYIGGAVSGIAYYQSNPTKGAPGDVTSYMDLANAQVTLQKTDGWFQYYVQAGEYSFPTIGTPYFKSSLATPSSFGIVPVAYIKLQGDGAMADWSIEGGKLPTLTGDEYNFTFENMTIERGLLWNIEPAISRGVQVNYADGPLTVSLSWNDGYYSNVLNTLSGLVSYVFSPSDTLAFSASGDVAGQHFSLLDSGSLYDLIWTHTSGNWVISPYFQYSTTPSTGKIIRGTTETGAALLVSYSVDDNWKLGSRFEYETSTGHNFANAPNIIGYGAGSNAWDLTLTPTYQLKQWFARMDLSYIQTGSATPGDVFGKKLTATDQERVMLETGFVF
ncbi:MAG TPA: outer membrane beta-barrel protein [Rhizomicrobium sp.]|nr:outer membrane beta-barrel protein [Rhizomicrobium sp.]